MIRFHLKCDQNHTFESWFQSGEAFEKLVASGMITCAACGSTAVSKSVMAPAVSTSTAITALRPTEAALAQLRDAVEQNADYVGGSFFSEARGRHEGRKPERSIYGEARLDEARKLAEDGIPVMPLPFIPRKKTN